MTRITTQLQIQTLINNMQDSFGELSRLQNMLQTQKAMLRPSDDPVTSNQAIRLERNLHEIEQYQRNVDEGYDLLTYSDEILSNLDSQINTARSKASQGIDTFNSEARSVIAAELDSIYNQFISVGNTTLGDKSIFAGRDYLGSPFKNIGSDVLFNGDSDSFLVNVFGTESIQANVTAEQAFGVLGTELKSERNLDTRVSPLSFSNYVEAGTLVLKEGTNNRSSSLSVTIAASSTIDTVVKTINAGAATAATAFTNAQTAAQTAYAAAGGTGTLTWATITPTDSTQMEALAVRRAIDQLTSTVGTKSLTDLTETQKNIVQATQNAARNEYAKNEFFAAKTRGGLVITHKTGNIVSVDEANSTTAVLHDLELVSQHGNSKAFIYNDALSSNLAADRTMTFTSGTGKTQTVSLFNGDTVQLVADRINRTFNQTTNLDSSFNTIVASVDTSSGSSRLSISSDQFFKITGVDELDATSTTAENANDYTGLYGYHNRIEHVNGGGGATTGQVQLETTNPTGYSATVTVRENDSLNFIVEQFNNLAGYEASLNTDGTGIDLLDVSRYSVTVTPATTNDLTITLDSGMTKTISAFAGTTFSAMAEEINALSTTGFKIHAEYNGTNLTLSSNEKFNLTSTANTALIKTSAQLTERTSRTTLFPTELATSLGLGKLITTATDSTTSSTEGEIKGANILPQQTLLKDLNNGDGVELGSLRFTIGTAKTEVDLSSAVNLRDVKDLIETALPNSVTVTLNNTQNGLAIKSKSTTSVLLEEVGSGLTGRHLGLIPAPSNSVTSTDIQGVDVNPLLHQQTLLKDLNAGTGIDLTGFVIRNGYTGTDVNGVKTPRQTTITFDTNGDGVTDVHTVQDLVSHINQKSKQDGVHVEASFDRTNGKIQINSRLASSDLQITELAKTLPVYRSAGIANAHTGTITLSDGTNSVALSLVDDAGGTGITGTGLARAQTIAAYINSIAVADTATLAPVFPFQAVINENEEVEIISSQQLTITSTATPFGYSMSRDEADTPVIGSTASDLGLLGAFSDSTLLSELNNGAGFTPGSFKIKWGSKNTDDYSVSGIAAPTAGSETITFYNENATLSTTATLTAGESLSTIVTNINTALTTLGVNNTFTASVDAAGTSVQIRGTQKFKLLNTTTPATTYKTKYNSTDTLASTASSKVIDLEFAQTLGDIKRVVEKETSNAVKVSFGHSNRLQFTIASNDSNQLIEFEEINDTGTTATTLGLIKGNTIQGRELRDGATTVLTESTTLASLGFTPNTSAASNSTENHLVIGLQGDSVTIDTTSMTTVGDVINAINAVTIADSGNASAGIDLTAEIVDGKFLQIKKVGQSDTNFRVVSSGFSKAAEKLGFINDPTLSSQPVTHSSNLNPTHHGQNFFSALKTLINELRKGDAANVSIMATAHGQLETMQGKYLEARAEAGGRIARFDALRTRFEDESIQLEDLFGKKTTVDVIETTQMFLQQQLVYESGLSSVSRVLGLSLFSFL